MEKEFIEKLADILDTDVELHMDTDLLDVEEWDSVGFINFIAMVTLEYQKEDVKITDVRNAVTVKDLYNLIK